MKKVEIHTDGACRGNPGPGGWGAILRAGDHKKELSGAEAESTNNRMEMTAVIEAFRSLKQPARVTLTTDSTYVLRGATEWMTGWKKRGWRTAARKPVKNRELWEALDAAMGEHEVTWVWVRGHTGDPGNERADELANLAIDAMLESE